MVFGKGEMLPYSLCGRAIKVISGEIKVYISHENGGRFLTYTLRANETDLLNPLCEYVCTKQAQIEFADTVDVSDTLRQKQAITNLLYCVMFHDVESRILQFLKTAQLEKRNGYVSVTQLEIAEGIGAAREVVCRVLKRMQKHGIIQFRRGAIKVLDEGEGIDD